MSKTVNIIQRRDLDPLLFKACEIVRHYEKAANCLVSVLGPDCKSVEFSSPPKAVLFCTLCKRFCEKAGRKLSLGEYPCASMHFNAIQEARRLGGSYIYTCPVGFIFWTSPFYSGERFAGALMSSGILAVDRQQAAERIFQICGGEMSRKEIDHYLEGIPEKTGDEIKALAQMMLICAGQISGGENRPVYPLKYGEEEPPAADRPLRENTCFLDKERVLLASLRRGDNDDSRKILKELMAILYESSGGNFDCFKMRVIELVVFLSRAAVESDETDDVDILETNSRYLKKIEDSQNMEEVAENLNLTISRMSGKFFCFQGVRHASALRKAERFIWENYTRKISLQEVARASGLSAPYFSTVFKEEMGENLSNYLNRLRVEKAAAMLKETNLPISEIAAACGFEDQSWFSKIFRNYAGFSPGKYREYGGTLPPEQAGETENSGNQVSGADPGSSKKNTAARFIMRPQRSLPVSSAGLN
jgi:AraC-like DNA-binding protein/ligand-binding sensor protein